jgi:polysaccharide deacetylase family protein (PEP-CTERM system associated)
MNRFPSNKKHLLTVLVEDYFHVGAFENLIQKRNWQNFEPRYEQNTLKTLDLLDKLKTKATFFVLGWIAEQNPKLIKEIAARGHEVASRGFYHRSLSQLTSEEIREDLRRTSQVLQEASGQKIIGYRSAEKLSYEKDERIISILADEGFAYDASFVPTTKTEKPKRFAHQIHKNGQAIWEFPYSTRNLGVGLLPISGGNYFRQIPYTLMRHAVRDWTRRYEEPFVFYFHVWELDPEQPKISAASRYNQIRHYRKLDKMEWIIKENLELYDFCDVAEFLDLKDSLQVQSPKSEVQSQKLKVQSPKSEVQNPKSKISVVIPCYNESEALNYLSRTLCSVEEELNEKGFHANFIFVDDRSSDDTFDKLHQLFGEKENFRIIQHETNQGVAAGIMTGIKAAETEIVCSMDCDCTYDPHELATMIPLLTEDVDMVTASPYHKKGGVRNVPEWRLFLSKGASWLYRRTLKAKLSTYTSCFRVYRRSSVIDLDIKEKGFLGVAEMLGKLDISGGTIIEYPAILEVRLFGISKMKTLRTIFGHLKLLSHLSNERLFRKNKAIREREEWRVKSEENRE